MLYKAVANLARSRLFAGRHPRWSTFSLNKRHLTGQEKTKSSVTTNGQVPNNLQCRKSNFHRQGLMWNQEASMSYDSTNKVHQTIHNLITSSKKRVFVFMKGVPSEPLCRYSGVVIQILDAYGVEFDSCDVLENAEIRQEIKSYSDWPTIPQVYMDGSFVGGCDILLQMHQSGELKQLFGDGSPKTGS